MFSQCQHLTFHSSATINADCCCLPLLRAPPGSLEMMSSSFVINLHEYLMRVEHSRIQSSCTFDIFNVCRASQINRTCPATATGQSIQCRGTIVTSITVCLPYVDPHAFTLFIINYNCHQRMRMQCFQEFYLLIGIISVAAVLRKTLEFDTTFHEHRPWIAIQLE